MMAVLAGGCAEPAVDLVLVGGEVWTGSADQPWATGIAVTDGVISDYGQDVKACALGQAAAAIVGANIVGLTPDQVQTGRDQLFAMLKSDGPVPDAPFGDLEVLQPAKDYKNRHASIMLAFDATLDALRSEQASA